MLDGELLFSHLCARSRGVEMGTVVGLLQGQNPGDGGFQVFVVDFVSRMGQLLVAGSASGPRKTGNDGIVWIGKVDRDIRDFRKALLCVGVRQSQLKFAGSC
jgi:hypothetical protein